MNLDLDELPHGEAIFDRLRRGVHVDEESDYKYFSALEEHFEAFQALFGYLGFDLERHDRHFFYFRNTSSSRQVGKRAQRMSVFFFVFVDALGSRGEDVVETLFRPEGHRIEQLPHFERAQHRECLANVDLRDHDDLRRLVRTMARYNFAERLDGESFRLRDPAWRFVELCREYADKGDDAPHDD
jgi:hypothetical protein